MSTLIVYATIEGQTGKIAQFVKNEIEKLGEDTETVDANDPLAETSYNGIDRVILAAPVHERRHPKRFEVLVASDQEKLNGLPTLFLSVSLSAAFAEGLEEADDYATEMEMRTGFKPSSRLLVAGAIRNSQYDYYASQVLRHIVFRGREVDTSQSEHEFTDWGGISAAVADFLKR